MEWNQGSYLRPVPPFVSPSDNSMGFLYNYYDQYPGNNNTIITHHLLLCKLVNGKKKGHREVYDLNMMKYPAVVGQGSSAHAMGSGSMKDVMMMNGYASGNAREQMGDQKKTRPSTEQRARWKAKQMEQLFDKLKHQFEVVSSEKKQLKREFNVVFGENKHLQEEIGLGLRMGGRRAEEGWEVGHGGRRPHLPEAVAKKSELEVERDGWT
ncbi:hypothetical protein RHSIM_Rhsim03G0084300 [Rhododendron simsii]|uniref:Uncharacterized protein n=1 Tax=Rhododendron simsii TaxID=118357 RepID=A0A834LPP1_RHOSS|nr:hypothetical protein RHSIM_Rhsim03G0084300 [Rhododendron simsii]